ncbi:MAG: hypothetical protein KME40_07160 [Komarekiella atlantica HA4396-MV6]|nr:hypothetical protein [Komarekiella atlantica HA4396-MV6]
MDVINCYERERKLRTCDRLLILFLQPRLPKGQRQRRWRNARFQRSRLHKLMF